MMKTKAERKEPMVHVNLRVPAHVLEHFKKSYSYTKAMREVLIQHVNKETRKEKRNENG